MRGGDRVVGVLGLAGRMTDPVSVIAHAMVYDHDPTNGACRILRALHDAGLEVVPRQERILQANYGALATAGPSRR